MFTNYAGSSDTESPKGVCDKKQVEQRNFEPPNSGALTLGDGNLEPQNNMNEVFQKDARCKTSKERKTQDCQTTAKNQCALLKFTALQKQESRIQLLQHKGARFSSVPRFSSSEKCTVPVRRKLASRFKRKSKQHVRAIILDAFSKSDYLTTKELIKITKQPIRYLRKQLMTLCVYVRIGPNKRKWKLKGDKKSACD